MVTPSALTASKKAAVPIVAGDTCAERRSPERTMSAMGECIRGTDQREGDGDDGPHGV